MTSLEIYKGSDGALTRAFYGDLVRLGPPGIIAMNLFRAQKCSERAKKYRGGIPGKGSYRELAYDRKNWSLDCLCKALVENALFTFGWKIDPNQAAHKWVLYVDLPTGQVSFHSGVRYAGPDYAGEWDGKPKMSPMRIVEFCDLVLRGYQWITATPPRSLDQHQMTFFPDC